MAEGGPFSSITDDETVTESEEEDVLRGTDEKGSASKLSPLRRLFGSRRNEPLSIQSGDITRPAPSDGVPKSGFYTFLFSIVHKCVKVLFFEVNAGGVRIPVVSWFPLVCSIAIAIILGVLAVFKFPPTLNINIVQSFRIPDHVSAIQWDAYQAALGDHIAGNRSTGGDDIRRNRRESSPTSGVADLQRRSGESCPTYSNTQHYVHGSWLMDLVFLVPEDKADRNVLTQERINYIHSVEEHIYNSSAYKNFCHKSRNSDVCDPITSLLTYLYPRQSDGSYKYGPDGLVPDVQAALFSLKSDLSVALWFTGAQVSVINGSFVRATLLRSQIRVGVPLPGYCGVYENYNEQNAKVVEFFLSLMPYLDTASKNDVDIDVLYGGTSIFDILVSQAIYHDAMLAIYSGVLILLVMLVLSGLSPFSTFFGLLAIISCFPLAFFVYRVVLGITTLGILNVVSLFVIIGIGVDDVFVYLNTFKQSAKLKDLDTVHKRLTHTIIVAGKATFFTSITTSVAFFANAISVIPAVKQFGIFMGLVILFCYLQVSIIMPFYLHIWHRFFVYLEIWILYPFMLLCRRKRVDYSTLPSVRMSNVADDDSGIDIVEQGNGSEQSENSSTGSGSDSGSSTALLVEPEDEEGTDKAETVPLGRMGGVLETRERPLQSTQDEQTLVHGRGGSTAPAAQSEGDTGILTAENRLTTMVQVFMMTVVAAPVMAPRLWKPRNSILSVITQGSFIWVFCIVVAFSILGTSFLQPTNHQPQFFNPDSNLQKLLDLNGNLTDSNSFNCWECSAWYTSYAADTPPPTIPATNPPATHFIPVPPTASTTASTMSTTHETPPTTQETPPTTQETPPTTQDTPPTAHDTPPTTQLTPPTTQLTPPTTQQTPPTTQQTPPTTQQTPPTTQQTPPTMRTTTSTPPTTPQAVSTTHAASLTTQTTAPPTANPTPNGITPGTSQSLESSRFSNKLIVYVVFGIKGVERNYSSAHVLPEPGEGDYAVLDPAFHGNFSCPKRFNSVSLDGAVRALCRICKNITEPANGLVLNRSAQCFPASQGIYSLGCLAPEIFKYRYLAECHDMFSNSDSPSVVAQSRVDTNSTDNSHSLRFLSMAFRSTTYQGDSPFTNALAYQKWDEFLANEMEDIKRQSGPGDLYEGAYDLLSSAYQTSDHWVQVNTELAAIYGSVYGIIISFVLCSIVVAILSHNWRIVVSMLFTILGILLALLALFRVFGWRLGIVEAISLSILVGNSLDYCIHLTEGYLATDARHLAFVGNFKFAAGASVRVKRAMAAISFIGVSIISSALTTIIATMPLLFTVVEPFKRFGAILVIDTLIAILYTLLFCSTFLSFLGPKDSKWSVGKLINAILTITLTLGGYSLLIFVLYISSLLGVVIPTADGGALFH